MRSVNPYLNFNGNTEEAFGFYRSVFGGDFRAVIRYRDFSDNGMGVAEKDLDLIAHVALPLGSDGLLMGTDALEGFGGPVTMGSNFLIALEPDTGEEADRLFAALSEGGRVLMPLEATEWAEKHGQCVDRFGVQWMIDYAGNVDPSQFPPAG